MSDEDEVFAEQLAALDQGLAEGTLPPDSALFPENPRLQAAFHSLQRVERFWPRNHSAEVPLLPTGFGRFRLIRLLGTGGFGIVYLAEDSMLGREVAVKMPRPEALMTPTLRARFVREARAVAQLQHPRIVPIFDSGEMGAVCFIVSAYCSEGSLGDWLKKQETLLTCRTAAQLIAVLAEAVEHAHQRGILHCDLKPANILLTSVPEPAGDWEGFPFAPHIADFGLAKVIQVAASDGDPTLSGSSTILGTPAYMAPEQARGDRPALTPATDVYALGAILYELLTGHPPFRAASNLELLQNVANQEPTPPVRHRAGLLPDLEAICLKCLEKVPERRYQSAVALAEDLANFLSSRPTRARPLTLWQRGLKWARRRPAISLGVPGCCLLVVGLLVGTLWYHQAKQKHEADLGTAALREKEQAVALETLDKERQADLAAAVLREQKQATARAKIEKERDRLIQRQNYLAAVSMATARWKENRHEQLWESLHNQWPQPGQDDLRGFEWYYLWAQGRAHVELTGHQVRVDKVRFSADGRLLFSVARDAVMTRDGRTGHLRGNHVLTGAPQHVVAISPEAHRFVTSAAKEKSTELTLWDGRTGRQLASRTFLSKTVVSVALHPNGKKIALSNNDGPDGMVRYWDPASGQVTLFWQKSKMHISALEYAPDGKSLAVATVCYVPNEGTKIDAHGAIEILDSNTANGEKTLSGHAQFITSVAFSQDGKVLASRALDGNIRVWDLPSGKLRGYFWDANQFVGALAISPGGTFLAASARANPDKPAQVAAVWDMLTGKQHCEPFIAEWGVSDLAFAPNGQTLAMACRDQKVRYWRFADQAKPFHSLTVHDKTETWGIAFAPDRPILATSGDDHLAKLWDISTHKEIARCSGHTSLVMAVAFSPDGSRLATAGYDGTVRLWNPTTGKETKSLLGHNGPVRSVAFSPDGKLLASAGNDKSIKLWNPVTGEMRSSLSSHVDKVRQVVFASDGKTLFSGGNDSIVTVWNAVSGDWVQTIPETSEVWALAHSPREPFLAVATKEGDVKLRRSDSGELRAILKGHSRGVLAVAFSPDGKTLASAGHDQSIRLWHVATGQELLCFKDLSHQINGLAFSADGHFLAAALHDGTVRIWDASK